MHKGDKRPSRLLVLASGLTEARVSALSKAMDASTTISALLPAGLAPFDAVVIDGRLPDLQPNDIDRLTGYVEAGGRVLAIDAASEDASEPLNRLLGFRAEARLPLGEFFGHFANPEHDLVGRLPLEFALVDAFRPLVANNGSATPIVQVNVHFRERAVIAEHVIGGGRIIVTSLGATDEALDNPSLQTIFRRALAPRRESAPDVKLGVAIVGYGLLGGMGFVHATAIESTPGLALAAICDTNTERLEAAHAIFPGATLHTSVDTVLDDPAVDIAIVATPPSSHVALSLRLLEAGKHVVCEKPLCFTVAEADELIEAALSRGLVLTVNQNRRWDADFLTVRGVIESGQLGDVFNIETFVGSFEHPCREWHSESAISGGAEFDWGAHYIDWILQFYGDRPSMIYANGHKRVWHDVTNLDQVRVRMVWEDGREAEFIHSDVAGVRRPKFYIQGTQGTLVGHYRPLVSERIDAGRGYVREELHHTEAPADFTLARYEPLGGGLREQRLPLVQREPFAFYRNLADHLLLDDAPLVVDYRQTRALISVLEAAHNSAERNGRPMTPG